MRRALLDVNVLLALAWPNHVFHPRAHAWFRDVPDRRWATCPLTQTGFVRLSCNPKVTGVDVPPARALEMLIEMAKQPGHEFWSDAPPLSEALDPFLPRLSGHRQITDAYLLGLAIRAGGALATFDRRVAALLPADSPHRDALEPIPA